MSCPRCGASTSQTPSGGWSCGNCGWSTGFIPVPTVPASGTLAVWTLPTT